MTNTTDIWVFPLEPLDNRYTKQWYDEIPRILGTTNKVYNAVGEQRSTTTTAGAFLDFADTNYWKSTCGIHFFRESNWFIKTQPNSTVLFKASSSTGTFNKSNSQ